MKTALRRLTASKANGPPLYLSFIQVVLRAVIGQLPLARVRRFDGGLPAASCAGALEHLHAMSGGPRSARYLARVPDDAVPDWVSEKLTTTRVATLGTVDADGDVRLVPVCFASTNGRLVSAVDHKPKRTGQLRRLDDIRAQGRATLLLDQYDEDWTQLWWVRVRGVAEVHPPDSDAAAGAYEALGRKYAQYRDHPPHGDVVTVAIDELRWWRW